MLCGNQQHDVSVDVQRLHEITAFAATPQVACLGGRTGSISGVSFGDGSLSSTEAEVPFELRDADPGIRGLWGFVSRGNDERPREKFGNPAVEWFIRVSLLKQQGVRFIVFLT